MDKRIFDEVFFSVDGEFDGTHPPSYSMLSFGVVAFTLKDGIIGEFTRNLKPLPRRHSEIIGTEERHDQFLRENGLEPGITMSPRVWEQFWSRFPHAYEATLTDQVDPVDAMRDFRKFYMNTVPNPRHGVLIEYPGGIDYFWCHWYFMEFLGEDPFGHSRAMSMKSYAAAVNKSAFCHATNRNMPKRWFASKLKHNHIAIDDARGQAHLAIRMMCEHHEIDLPEL